MNPLVVALAGLAGLLLGPSLHHLGVSWGARMPAEGVVPRCSECGAPRPLSGLHRRRCAACETVGRRREIMVVLLSGLAFTAAAAVADTLVLLPAFLVLAFVTVVLVVTDLDHKLIPNRVLYPWGSLALGLLAAGALAEGRGADLVRALAGGAAYFGVLFLVALLARGGFGFGDVKLAALLGAFTAFEGLQTFLLSIFFTGVFGGIPAIFLLVFRRAGRGDELPYGPAMIFGAWTALVFGGVFLRWYG